MPAIKIKFNPNRPQAEFLSDTTTKILHMSAGLGTGKSTALVMKMLHLSWLNRPYPGGLVVPSIADFKKDIQPMVEDILDSNRIRFQYHKTDKWYRFPWSPGRLYVATAENKIRGPNWAYAGINEVTLLKRESFMDTLGRVRIKGSNNPQIVMSGTPEGTSHWLYELLVENPLPNSKIIYGSTKENQENLSSDFINTLYSSYDKAMIDAYVSGMFVNMKGNRFYYAYDPQRHDSKSIVRREGLTVYVTLDFNVSPMCATLWHIVNVTDPYGRPIYGLDQKPLRRLEAFDQVEIEDNATTHQMCDALFAKDLHPDSTVIYPDPAGNARSTKGIPDNEILKQRGFYNVKTRSVAPNFRKRQLAVNNLFDKDQILINPITAKGIKRDMESVEQNKLTFEKLKDNPRLTHFSDGLDYMADIEFPLSGNRPNSGTFKIR